MKHLPKTMTHEAVHGLTSLSCSSGCVRWQGHEVTARRTQWVDGIAQTNPLRPQSQMQPSQHSQDHSNVGSWSI